MLASDVYKLYCSSKFKSITYQQFLDLSAGLKRVSVVQNNDLYYELCTQKEPRPPSPIPFGLICSDQFSEIGPSPALSAKVGGNKCELSAIEQLRRKRKLNQTEKEDIRKRENYVQGFWSKHYDMESHYELKAGDAYEYFLHCHQDLHMPISEFKTHTGRITILKTKYCKLKQFKSYMAYPKTKECLAHHHSSSDTNCSHHQEKLMIAVPH